MSQARQTDALVVAGLRKRYPGAERPSIDGLSFRVRAGEVAGLLGPNGAGKTTLVKMVCGVSKPTAGSVTVFGADPFLAPLVAKHNIAAMHQGAALDMMLPAVDTLRIAARFRGLRWRDIRPWVHELTDFLGLDGATLRKLAFQLSGGQKQRLQLARALLGVPRLLVLDEPSAALDVAGRRLIWEFITWLRTEHHVTILWASHHIDELERNCDRVLVLNQGRMIRFAPPRELVHDYGSAHLLVTVRDDSSVPAVVSWATAAGCQAETSGPDVRIRPPERNGAAQSLLSALTEHCRQSGLPLVSVSVQTDSLEDVFMRLTHDGGRTRVEA